MDNFSGFHFVSGLRLPNMRGYNLLDFCLIFAQYSVDIYRISFVNVIFSGDFKIPCEKTNHATMETFNSMLLSSCSMNRLSFQTSSSKRAKCFQWPSLNIIISGTHLRVVVARSFHIFVNPLENGNREPLTKFTTDTETDPKQSDDHRRDCQK